MPVRLRITLALQVLGRLDEHHFQGRPHMRLDEMAAVCRPVRFADNHVRVHLWFALVSAISPISARTSTCSGSGMRL